MMLEALEERVKTLEDESETDAKFYRRRSCLQLAHDILSTRFHRTNYGSTAIEVDEIFALGERVADFCYDKGYGKESA